MNQQERKYYDHSADPSTMIMYKKMMMKEKVFKYTLLSLGAGTVLFIFLFVLHAIANI